MSLKASDPEFWKMKEKQDQDRALIARENMSRMQSYKTEGVQDSQMITRETPEEELDVTREVLFETISDILWDRIFYLSSFSTQTVTTSSSTEDLTIRASDTSENTYLSPDKESRMRLTFYLNSGQQNAICYLGMASSTSLSAPTSVTDSTISFAGVRIQDTEISLFTHNGTLNQQEAILTQETITDNTTHLIEFRVIPKQYTEVIFNGTIIGQIKTPDDYLSKTSTFFPYITSISSSGGSVNLTVESYEFLQNRN